MRKQRTFIVCVLLALLLGGCAKTPAKKRRRHIKGHRSVDIRRDKAAESSGGESSGALTAA